MKRRLYSILWYCCWVLAAELVAVAMVVVAICILPLCELLGLMILTFGILMGVILLVLGPVWAIFVGLTSPIGKYGYALEGRRKRIAVMLIGTVMLLISATWWIPSYLAYRTRVANDSWRDWGERQYRTQSVKCPCAMVYIKEVDGSIEKVFTGLPEGVSFHKNYEVVTNSDEELLIRGRGTNVCNRLVGKQKGRWRAYQHEGNEIRYFDELWF